MNSDPYFRIMCAKQQLEYRQRSFPDFQKVLLIQTVVVTEMHAVRQCLYQEFHNLDLEYALEENK